MGIDSGLTTIEEINTSSSYEIRIKTGGVTNPILKFRKGDTNTIVYELGSLYDIVLTKQ